MYWIEDLIESMKYWKQEVWRRLKPYCQKLFSNSMLMLVAAIASAIASWFGFQAAERSVQVATAAQMFTEKVSADQMALARPSVAVLGGSVSPTRQEKDYVGAPIVVYRIEVRIRNSGGRNARPVWLQLRRGSSGSSFMRDVGIFKLTELPKDVDLPIVFESREKPSLDETWLVGIAFGDDIPRDSTTSSADKTSNIPNSRLKRHCYTPTVVQAKTYRDGEQGDTGDRVSLSPGSPIIDPTPPAGHASGLTQPGPVEELRKSVRLLQVEQSDCDFVDTAVSY